MDKKQILQRLLEGNQRFSRGDNSRSEITTQRRMAISKAQRPFAMVLGCSDSRVPPEIIFDCGLGDLFVIRTAGHTVDSAVRESIFFGIQVLNIPLVIVLGHSRCGAVEATWREQQKGGSTGAKSWIAAQISLAMDACRDENDILDCAVRQHVKRTVSVLETLVKPLSEDISIVGGYYDLDTGLVEILKT